MIVDYQNTESLGGLSRLESQFAECHFVIHSLYRAAIDSGVVHTYGSAENSRQRHGNVDVPAIL